jgi:hypothetical protein
MIIVSLQEEAELNGLEYEEGLAMMEDDDDMSEDEEVRSFCGICWLGPWLASLCAHSLLPM